MKILFTAMVSLCLLIACNSKAKMDGKSMSAIKDLKKSIRTEEFQSLNTDTTIMPGIIEDQEQKKQPTIPKEPTKEDWDKKIIKTASLDIEVKNYTVYYNQLRETVKSVGGYIAQEDQHESPYKIENTIVIKVPVDQFDNTLSGLGKNIEKLNEKKVTSQDVTTEYVDTRSRMESKKQVRLRYLDLLKQAKNMEEVLNVQSEINDIQEEIEAATGRIDYLSHSATYSTINLTYFQVLNASAKDVEHPGFSTQVKNAFKTGWGWIVDLFVGLVSIWPLLLLIFICVISYKRIRTRKLKEA